MSGITRKNQAGVSGLVGPVMDFQRITTTGSTQTWTKPDGVSIVWIECIGGGAGGGGGQTGGYTDAGGGGGGGAMVWGCFSADALAATLSVIIGATANGGAHSGGDGTAGNYSSVATGSVVILKAWGGGSGFHGGATGNDRGGGGGGGRGDGGSGDGGAGGLGARGEVRIWAW